MNTAANPQNSHELKAMLESMANWDISSLETFAQRLNEMVARRKSPSLTKAETDLLLKINQGIPTAILEEYTALKTRQKTIGIAADEQNRLNELITAIEEKEAELLGNLIGLARLRRVSVEKLRKQLGIITPVPYAW
jgi:hypothetical protein